MTTQDLLIELGPDTALASLIRRARDAGQPWVVVRESAVTAWARQDPERWAKVARWLEARGVAIVRI
jgi:hypothetical protein